MVLIIIIIILCGLLYYYYKPNIDFVIAEKGFKVLLWYNKWDSDSDDTFTREYIHLFNIRLKK
jgi:hypothetical protein